VTGLTWQQILFFFAGALFSWATVYISLCWPEIYEAASHQPFNSAWAPRWYLVARDILDYLPLISVAVIALLRMTFTQRLRPVSYTVGVAAFYLVVFVILVYGMAHSPF
jgi:hypothetical protein